MTPGWLVAHRRAVVGLALAVWAAGLVAFVGIVAVHDLDFFGPLGGPWVVAFAPFAITGAVITWQRPDNVIGPLFLVLGVAPPIANTLAAAAMGPFAAHDMGLRALFVAVRTTVTTAMFPLLPLLVLLFPDGRPPSPRWRGVCWMALAAAIVGAGAAFTTGRWGGDDDQQVLVPPFDGRLEPVGSGLSGVYFLLVVALFVLSVTALAVRFRRSDARTRRQILWLLLSAVLLVIVLLALVSMQEGFRVPPGAPAITAASFIGLVPVSVALAILRDRLYDIDLALNRTIVFGLLAAFITALYVTVVVGLGSLLGDPSNVVLSVGATALVAGVFEPVRARVQHWANVAVYGRRATPYEVLATIAGDLGSVSENEGQLEAMAALLADGTGAQHATVWVEDGGALRALACWPRHDPGEHPVTPLGDDGVVLPRGAAHVEPVRRDDDLLGALSLDRRRDDPVSPREQQLVAELAGQASLVLGNARLREQLRARLEELRASRRRLVATQDEARRRLERDLHDGAQQQLVALKVKLGMARTLADKEGAGAPVADLLAEVAEVSDGAVESLRTLARGIYPPLLEAEGLERAVSVHTGSAPVEATVTARGVGRYSRDVEATVYFCVVEALANCVRHADPTHVEVVLEDDGERLVLEITDDGRGFDPSTTHGPGLTNMADRVEAIGGVFTVEASPGAGCRIHAAVPDPARVATAHAATGETLGPTGG